MGAFVNPPKIFLSEGLVANPESITEAMKSAVLEIQEKVAVVTAKEKARQEAISYLCLYGDIPQHVLEALWD